MSAQSDLIDFFQLNATFDPTTRTTHEVFQSSDRAQLQRQVATVKVWKRQAEPIGHGGSGIIWLEYDEDGKESRVIKQILKETPTTPLQADYKRELQALGRLSKRQDLFVHFYGWFENDTSIFLAMEYFELGDLEKFITPELTEKDAKVIGRQLLEGLQVLHGYHLAHRDLKPANVFVARCAPDWWIKLGDFGIVRRICTENNSKLTRIGTLDYMAPEILLENDDEEQNSSHTLAVDVWSLGCVLFRLLTQQLPFPLPKHLRLYWQLRKPFPTDVLLKNNVSEDGASFVSELMKSNPADRMTVTTALLHSWVSIQEFKQTPKNLDSFKENIEDKLDGESANEGFATEIHSTSHTGNRDTPHENQELLPSNSYLTSLQNEEVVQLRKYMPDAEERIFDLSDTDIDSLESRSNFANAFPKLGRHGGAMQLFQQTLEARRHTLGDEHPDTLQTMHNLAMSYSKLGQNQEAMNLEEKTLELRKLVLGDEHPDTLQTMNNLALSHFHLGRHQEAMHLGKQTLELRKFILGDEHPDTLETMRNLAISYSKLGQHQDAMHLHKQTLELRKRVLGDKHPDTLQTMHYLAVSYCMLGQNQEAMNLEEKTLELRKLVLGDEHPDTLQTMNNLASSHFYLGQHQEAMHLGKKTLEFRKSVLGDEHPNTLETMHNLAVYYSKLGQHQDAMHLRKQSLELQKRVMGDEHPDTLETMHNLAVSYYMLGQDQGAMNLEEKTLELRKIVLGDKHPDTLQTMHNLALLYSRLGQDQEAMNLEEKTLELRKIVLGDKHPDTLQTMNNLALSYSRLGQD